MNQVAERWKNYGYIDAGSGEKLGRWRGIILCRPDPQVVWPMEENSMQNSPHAHYCRSKSDGGSWEYKKKFRDSWMVSYGDLHFKVSPTGFKHTGLLPGRATNWDWMMDTIQGSGREDLHVLGLFAYTGGATVACVSAGAAEVVRVNASKGMVNWAKKNMILPHLEDHKIRFIVGDVLKFVTRKKRRGRTYHTIIMDPPSYGRGSDEEIRKIEEQLYPLISACMEILDEDPPFFLVNSYTTGFPPAALHNLPRTAAGKKRRDGQIDAGEIGLLVTATDGMLPYGVYGKWVSSKR